MMGASSPAARATLGRVLVSQQSIAERMPTLAREIVAWLGDGDDEVVIVPVMTGAFIFAADLVRHMPVRMRITLATVSSYPGASTTSQGVRPLGDLPANLEGRRVLVIDPTAEHTEAAWAKRLPQALAFLFPPAMDGTK